MSKLPLDHLDQNTQEQMLIAAANDRGGTLLELVEMHGSEPFDRDIIIDALAEKDKIDPEAREAIKILMAGRERTRRAFAEMAAAESESLSDVAGHGYGHKSK